MELLKLQYSVRDDDYQICTVIGDFDSIYDLYYRLDKLVSIGNIEVHDIGSGCKLDMKKSMRDNQGRCSRLNSLERY